RSFQEFIFFPPAHSSRSSHHPASPLPYYAPPSVLPSFPTRRSSDPCGPRGGLGYSPLIHDRTGVVLHPGRPPAPVRQRTYFFAQYILERGVALRRLADHPLGQRSRTKSMRRLVRSRESAARVPQPGM